MLNSVNLDDKTYQDLMAEALTKIPLYSREWTNFNRSDPGITMLQNLSAFQVLQQSLINQVTDDIRRKLLELVGYRAHTNQAATVLLQVPADQPLSLPPQYSLELGSLHFETEAPVEQGGWSLAAAYVVQGERYQEISYLLDAQTASAAVFGARPVAGTSLCCILDGVPETDRPLLLWAQCPEDDVRNPFPAQGGPVFAHTRWQYYTEEGWQDAAAQDETRGFLVSGAISLTLDKGEPAVFPDAPEKGCALRCLLESEDYDRPPRLLTLAANLFPVRQWQTRAQSYCLPGSVTCELRTPLAALGNLFVYCRETPGGPYRAYTPFTGMIPRGRFYRREDLPDGVRLTFDPLRFGFSPCDDPDGIRIVCYDNEMVHHRDLGLVYGYEDQEVPVDLVEHVLSDHFCLLVEAPGADGETDYFFVPPGSENPQSLCYTVDHTAGLLHISHPGYGTGYRLYLTDCRVTVGKAGNIRPCGTLEHRGGFDGNTVERTFYSPAPGRGGVSYESAEDLRLRFVADTRRPATAVLPSDYELLAQRTPGLCIHKVKASANPEENLVYLAIKPYSEEPLPQLSSRYLQEIRAWLEPRRMLTTRIELVQPRYVPIDVRVVVYVKSYFDQAAGEIEALLRKSLDFVNGPQPFGSWVRFTQIYQSLLDLPCVEAVDDLRLLPAAHSGVIQEGPDLKLDDRSLCYPGQVLVEALTSPSPLGR